MRYLGLDLGNEKIGISLSDELLITAQPLIVLTRQGWKKDRVTLQKLIEQSSIKRIIVGLPKNMDNSYGERAKICQNFAIKLSGAFNNVKVYLWDERLTTVQAEKILINANVKRKERRKIIDKTAAALILQNYLDSNKINK